MVNLERTKAFGALVDSAESMIPKLPWSKDFEKDKFLSPDFTSRCGGRNPSPYSDSLGSLSQYNLSLSQNYCSKQLLTPPLP